jgi:hypothetical protein
MIRAKHVLWPAAAHQITDPGEYSLVDAHLFGASDEASHLCQCHGFAGIVRCGVASGMVFSLEASSSQGGGAMQFTDELIGGMLG